MKIFLKKTMLMIAVVAPLIASLSTQAFAAGTTVASVKTPQSGVYMKEIPKTPLPKDPRGPLPNFKSAEEAQQWFKDHPDPEQTQPKTVAPVKYGLAVEQKQIPFGNVGHGDLIFGHGTSSSSGSFSYGYFRHTGMYNIYAQNFVSANLGSGQSGVCTEPPYKWTSEYDDVSVNSVWGVTYGQKENVVQNALYHLGEPYMLSSKSTTNSWYCSKLSWFEYNKWGGVDLDRDGGYFVTPDDEYYSSYVHQYWRG